MRLPTDPVASTLARLYATAEAQIRALIADAVASGAIGTAAYRRQRLAVVQQILADLNAQAIPEATDLVVQGYQLGAGLGGMRPDFGTAVHVEAVEMLADALTNRLQDATERVGRQTEDVFRREGLRASALGLIQGGTRRDASAQLEEALVRQGIAGFRDRAGREWGLSTYAEMVVRTTTREAVSTATHHSMLEQDSDLVTITSHRSIDPDDDACLRIDGKTFSITGRTAGYPVLPLDEWPPMGTHPQCAHVVTPATANLDALERELGLAPPEPVAA